MQQQQQNKKRENVVKLYELSSLGVHISGFCTNSAKFCAVAQPHNHDI